MAGDIDYGYVAWKLRNARHFLQLPDPKAKETLVGKVLSNCALALNELESHGSLGDPAQGLADRLRGLIDASGPEHLRHADPSPAEAQEAPPELPEELPTLIDQLAGWVKAQSGEAESDAVE